MLLSTLATDFFGLVSAVNFSAKHSRWRKLPNVALKNDLEILKKSYKKFHFANYVGTLLCLSPNKLMLLVLHIKLSLLDLRRFLL
jgi:hypothetical protein